MRCCYVHDMLLCFYIGVILICMVADVLRVVVAMLLVVVLVAVVLVGQGSNSVFVQSRMFRNGSFISKR